MADRSDRRRKAFERLRRSRDRAADASIKRDFVNQAEALNRHEAEIARHTAIQSWTNIISVVIATVTTVALIAIAVEQYRTSKRQVDLEYARSANRYEFIVDTYPIEGSLGFYGLASGFHIQEKSGSQILSIYVGQMATVSYDRDSPTPSCTILIHPWFQRKSRETFILRDDVKNIVTSGAVFDPRGERISIRPSVVSVYIKYIDVFGKVAIDYIEIEGDSISIRRAVSDDYSYLTGRTNAEFFSSNGKVGLRAAYGMFEECRPFISGVIQRGR